MIIKLYLKPNLLVEQRKDVRRRLVDGNDYVPLSVSQSLQKNKDFLGHTGIKSGRRLVGKNERFSQQHLQIELKMIKLEVFPATPADRVGDNNFTVEQRK